MGDSEKKEKGFFKVFFPANSLKSLKIPEAFIEYKKGKLPKKVSLRDRYGNMWPIGLAEIRRDFYFQDGWEKFIEDNNAELGDFFICDYDGNDVFSFKILGKASCEKKGAGGLKVVVEEEEELNEHQMSEEPIDMNFVISDNSSTSDSDEDEDYIVEEEDDEEEGHEEEEEEDEEIEEKEENDKMGMDKKKAACSKVRHMEEEDDKDIEEEEEEETDKMRMNKKKAPCSKARHMEEDDDEEEEEHEEQDEETEEEEIEKAGIVKKKASCSKATHMEEEEDGQEEVHEEEEGKETEEEEEPEKASIAKKKASCSKAGCKRATTVKGRDLPDQYGADLFKSGRATQPKNPYFVTKVRTNRRDHLYIPIEVVRDYKLELPPKMILRDSVGREFETNHKLWKDGRIWLNGGWRSLCRWNLVEKDDQCICEFLQGEKGLYLQVHVVHQEKQME